MVDGHLNIAVFGMDIGKKLMCLSFFVTGSGFKLALANLQETRQACNGLIKLAQFFMNETDPLVALSLLFLVIGALTCFKTLLEVLKGAVEFVTLLEINGNDLVDADELARDLTFDLSQARLYGLLKCCFQMIHCLKNVQNFLLADTETLVGLGFTLGMLGFN